MFGLSLVVFKCCSAATLKLLNYNSFESVNCEDSLYKPKLKLSSRSLQTKNFLMYFAQISLTFYSFTVIVFAVERNQAAVQTFPTQKIQKWLFWVETDVLEHAERYLSGNFCS